MRLYHSVASRYRGSFPHSQLVQCGPSLFGALREESRFSPGVVSLPGIEKIYALSHRKTDRLRPTPADLPKERDDWNACQRLAVPRGMSRCFADKSGDLIVQELEESPVVQSAFLVPFSGRENCCNRCSDPLEHLKEHRSAHWGDGVLPGAWNWRQVRRIPPTHTGGRDRAERGREVGPGSRWGVREGEDNPCADQSTTEPHTHTQIVRSAPANKVSQRLQIRRVPPLGGRTCVVRTPLSINIYAFLWPWQRVSRAWCRPIEQLFLHWG